MVVQLEARRVVTQDSYNDLWDAWRGQVERVRRGQESGWSLCRDLTQESTDAYEDFLGSIFFYYGEHARAAEKGAREGQQQESLRVATHVSGQGPL